MLFVLLKLVLNVPLCDPVFDELLELVLLGDAAVGTRCPYCKDINGWKILISLMCGHKRMIVIIVIEMGDDDERRYTH